MKSFTKRKSFQSAIKCLVAGVLICTSSAYYLQASSMGHTDIDYHVDKVEFVKPDNKLDFKMYPNPSTGGPINLEIEGIKNGALEIKLYNTIGKVLLNKSLETLSNQTTLSLETDSKLAPGLYFLTISSKEETVSKKLIVRD